MPVDSHQATAEVAAAYGLHEDGASLVRPDGFVAWRSRSGVPDPHAALAAAVDAALRRADPGRRRAPPARPDVTACPYDARTASQCSDRRMAPMRAEA